MIFADFKETVKTSDLEKVLDATFSELGYKVLRVKDNYHSEEYFEGKMIPIKEGIEYEVRKNFLGPKMYFGFKFKTGFEGKLQKFVYDKEQARQLYGWVYSLKEDKYKDDLLEVINTAVNKINNENKANLANITYYK
ncbi:MAG: hypothetical protein ACP5MV_04230 [Candidatus Parvarchaeum sp.]